MKICFVHQKALSFVKKDFEILNEVHEVRECHFRGIKNILSLFQEILWCDVVFCWFGKLHAFFAVLLSKLLGKKAVVVAGGDDVAYEPDVKYGMFFYWWKKWCPLFVFHYADLILSVSQFNRQETIKNAKADPVKVNLIYHGFDLKQFKPVHIDKKEQLVITVGGVDWERLERKGYELFVKSAAHLPEVQFAMIGQWHDDAIDYLREIASYNVTFTDRVSDIELVKWLSRGKVYVQASLHEAFGCSVAEAMLCECVPAVTRRAALPEVAGDCGFYIDELTLKAMATQIEKALASHLGKRARERIIREFPLEKRREALLGAVEEVMNK